MGNQLGGVAARSRVPAGNSRVGNLYRTKFSIGADNKWDPFID